ncbi:hypothetical protein GOP47_0014402 [Adiantum capillus-veneris]|uniref:Uncharacterized protein n=1 Tax=Adiantum capillus-veneris TaxID=13818 RepID=A0A9D4ZCF1_ADICA|nr:hypothetical protein GOP47_0014402 [Adiantum capillus-veneris]
MLMRLYNHKRVGSESSTDPQREHWTSYGISMDILQCVVSQRLPYLVLTKALTSKLAPNVGVNCVAPGFVRTHLSDFIFQHKVIKEEMKSHTSIDRFDKADDMAAVVPFLVSDDGAYITGEVLPVSGGIPSRL